MFTPSASSTNLLAYVRSTHQAAVIYLKVQSVHLLFQYSDWGKTLISGTCFVLVKFSCCSDQIPNSKQLNKRRAYAGSWFGGYSLPQRWKASWKRHVAAACYMILYRKQNFSCNQSQPVTPQPLPCPLTSASQIPGPKGYMTFGRGQQLRTNCISTSSVGDILQMSQKCVHTKSSECFLSF